jgi:large conductance mechanosensitive channel
MSLVAEFKKFAVKGNVVDMAVGIIIGAAFGKIVSSFVADIMTPPIGFLIGGVDFTGLAVSLIPPIEGAKEVTINYGKFLQAVFDFSIVAFALFLLVKGVNKLKAAEEPAAAPGPSAEEKLLAEIRDILQQQKG